MTLSYRPWYLWILLLVTSAAYSESLPDVIDKVRPSVVGIGTSYPPRQPIGKKRSDALMGTGFVVGNGYQIVTNSHVVPKKLDTDSKQVLAVFVGRGRNAKVYPARLILDDPLHDLALLKITAGPLPPMQLGVDKMSREGSDVAFTGFPVGAVLGLYPVTHRGIISALTPIARTADTAKDISAVQMLRMRNPFDVYQLDAVAYPGNSGSPVYENSSGKVLGVINSVFVKESRESVLERPSGISYAIPVKWVRELLRRADGL